MSICVYFKITILREDVVVPPRHHSPSPPLKAMTSDLTGTGLPEEITDGGIASTEGKLLLNSTQDGATNMDLLTTKSVRQGECT